MTLLVLASLGAASLLAIVGSGAFGASISAASFSGGAGTTVVGSTLYAKQGGDLTLSVKTDTDIQCVAVTGAQTADQSGPKGKTDWTFTFKAGSGDGVQTVTVNASKNVNQQGKCTGKDATTTASYVLDNTVPTVSGSSSPAANAAGWNRADATIAWTATDGGSGIGSGPTPATDSVTANTAGVTKTATATDRLGNTGSGSITVKLDKDKPLVAGSASPAPNANGWNNRDVTVSATCSDALSGIKSCTGGGTTVLASEGKDQSVQVEAVDNADNEASTTVGPFNIDKTKPSLTGAVAGGTQGDNGWYRSDVTIHWTAGDALSGVAGAPADSTITGEGQALTAPASVADKAGNQTTADSPTVKIDKTAPNTDAQAAGGWNNVDQTVTLEPNDALSGVAATHYRIDGDDVQTGTSISISAEGVHALEYWSVDKAGNAEAHKTVDLKLDKTSPTITHTFAPLANANGWFNDDVSVKFHCDDTLSGIKTCGPDRVISEEGKDRDASGDAVDNAGNSAHDPAAVSLDRTPPTITASRDRDSNANGWYDADVTVGFACADALSGVDKCPAAQALGEGADQSAHATVADAAGNTASDGVDHINVDKTAPELSGKAATEPHANGWYNGDVTVAWTASDALSGLDGDEPADSTIKGEGDNLSASASVKDKAGNARDVTVEGIKIDRTAPATTAKVAEPLASGWYAAAVKVTLTGIDTLSGVDRTLYSVDGGAPQVYDGAFDFAEKGTHTLTFWSVDNAGNTEHADDAGHAVTLKIDDIAPTITGKRAPDANGFGWNNSPVTVTFDCSDAESGIAGCSDPVTLSNEGQGQSVHGDAKDNAGNAASAQVDDINIDLTKPTLSGAATTAPNAAGWYRDDVTVHWTGTDGLSGIDESTLPGDSVVTGEGADLGTGPTSVADKAGNVASASMSAIKIDRHGPEITGAPKTSPNAAGWYSGDVVVGFTCADALSGVASCPSDMVVTGNGADRSATSGEATDLAGNTTPGTTVGGIKIDGLAPQTTADNQCTKVNDWCTGDKATVVLTATDQDGLSGVKELHYSVNGGAEQVVDGPMKGVDVPLDGSGEATVRFYAVDRAGNAEAINGVNLKYDNIAPMVTHSVAPEPNADAWNHDDVTVHFAAKDNDGGSGTDDARTTPDVHVGEETAGRDVTGEAYDVAGNRGTDKVTVKLDKTAPTVTGAIVSGQPNAEGWYGGPVKVHFTCSDGLSGVAVCPDDVTLTTNGKGQSVSGQAVDFAGNKASATVNAINIDSDKPNVAVAGVKDGAIYTLGAVPTPSCSATDELSGGAGCVVKVSGGEPNGVGTFTYTATAADKAGNTQTATGSYRVVYRWDGFLQPINDTAHDVGADTSIFKAGSTVPVKFELKRADGTVVQPNRAPAWETPVKGGPTTAPVAESVYGLATDSGASFRWEDQKYQYNWGAPKAGQGYYHRIGVRLDDGQTYFVNVGLR